MDLDTIGYFLFMEEQEREIENRSEEQDCISLEDEPRKSKILG